MGKYLYSPSILDLTVGKVPVLGNVVSAFLTLPSLLTHKGAGGGGYAANIGRRLCMEKGAHNIELDVYHAHAFAMYNKAREAISHVSDNSNYSEVSNK